jgi:hypothetical protein
MCLRSEHADAADRMMGMAINCVPIQEVEDERYIQNIRKELYAIDTTGAYSRPAEYLWTY